MDPVHELKFVMHSAGAAAGQTDLEPSAGVDCTGFDGVTFIVTMGAITSGSVVSIFAQSSSDDGVEDTYADIAGSSISVADDTDEKAFVIDVREPELLYVRCVVSRATEDAEVRSIVAMLHSARNYPITTSVATTGVAAQAAIQRGIQGLK